MANEIEKLKVELLDPELVALKTQNSAGKEDGKQTLAVSINEIIKSYLLENRTGVVEFEQQGNVKAKYGTSLLSNLAKLLRVSRARTDPPHLNNMRKF